MWGVIWPFLAAGVILAAIVVFWLFFEDDMSRRPRQGRTAGVTYGQAHGQVDNLFNAATDKMVIAKLRRAGVRR